MGESEVEFGEILFDEYYAVGCELCAYGRPVEETVFEYECC